MVGPDPAWFSSVRGCFIISAEHSALVSRLQLGGGHLGRYLVLKRQKSQECFYLSPFGLRLVPKSLILMVHLACVLVTLPGTLEKGEL